MVIRAIPQSLPNQGEIDAGRVECPACDLGDGVAMGNVFLRVRHEQGCFVGVVDFEQGSVGNRVGSEECLS